MGFREIDIKPEYRSDVCRDIGKEFISKILEESVVYKRAVGFFSSSALLKISKGINKLIERDNSHICLVVSPLLYEDDVKAMMEGYSNRKKIVEKALLREFKSTTDKFDCERLNLLCHLIEQGILDIKVADKAEDDSQSIGMFHEKIGLFIDEYGNKVAFTGSLNESDNAYSNNFESIHVYTSWEEPKRVDLVETDFDSLWDDRTSTLEVYEFPDAVKKELFKYRKDTYISDVDSAEKAEKDSLNKQSQLKKDVPECRYQFELYDYQKDAINEWARQKFRGLFDMGTGTGKTITALTAGVKLLERLNYKLATIIVCPYTHLVEQWVSERENFNIKFIVGYSDQKYSDYYSKLEKAIINYNSVYSPVKYFYFITTNATYKTEKVQNLLRKIKGNVLFIADEVHNFGASGFKDNLIESFKYRIGLSATIDRHGDAQGTEQIYNYFGNPVIHYGLREAIDDNVLTRYYYYPILVYLDEDEQDKYIELTEKIIKNITTENNKKKISKTGKILLLERARLIAVTKDKIGALKNAIKEFKDESNLLVYCGTGKLTTDNGDEVRQIDEVCRVLGRELDMKVGKYTACETAEERKSLTESYVKGEDLQALVAMKCLDEGVNIPCIKRAFILASSTNPREYIQRRGRVLRKFKGKNFSYIYDFITMPAPFDAFNDYDEKYINRFVGLAKREVNRIQEFSKLAVNSAESDKLIMTITDKFKLNMFNHDDEIENIDWEEN